MFSHRKWPFPALEHQGIKPHMAGGFSHAVAVFSDQTDRLTLELRRLRLACLSHHGTHHGSIASLVSWGPFLSDRNRVLCLGGRMSWKLLAVVGGVVVVLAIVRYFRLAEGA